MSKMELAVQPFVPPPSSCHAPVSVVPWVRASALKRQPLGCLKMSLPSPPPGLPLILCFLSALLSHKSFLLKPGSGQASTLFAAAQNPSLSQFLHLFDMASVPSSRLQKSPQSSSLTFLREHCLLPSARVTRSAEESPSPGLYKLFCPPLGPWMIGAWAAWLCNALLSPASQD